MNLLFIRIFIGSVIGISPLLLPFARGESSPSPLETKQPTTESTTPETATTTPTTPEATTPEATTKPTTPETATKPKAKTQKSSQTSQPTKSNTSEQATKTETKPKANIPPTPEPTTKPATAKAIKTEATPPTPETATTPATKPATPETATKPTTPAKTPQATTKPATTEITTPATTPEPTKPISPATKPEPTTTPETVTTTPEATTTPATKPTTSETATTPTTPQATTTPATKPTTSETATKPEAKPTTPATTTETTTTTKSTPPTTPKVTTQKKPASPKTKPTATKAKKTTTPKPTIKKAKKSTTTKKKKAKTDSSPLDSSIAESISKELDFLNKKISPLQKEKQALEYIRSKKSTDAIKLLESSNNISARSLRILASAYESKGDYENQIRVLKTLVKRDKKNGYHYLKLARALRKLYFKTGLFAQREEVVKTIDKIYNLDKKYHEKAHIEMLELLKFKEDTEETNYAILTLLQKLIREYGVKKIYVRDICKYLYINKFYKQSLAGCKKAIKYYPKEASNYIYYALSMPEPAETEKYIKKVHKKFPNSYLANQEIGAFFVRQKDYKLALPYFQKAASLSGNSAITQVGMAQSLFHTGQAKASYKHFLKACMLDKQKMLWNFKQAKSILNQKNQVTLAEKFEKGIIKCYSKAKYKK